MSSYHFSRFSSLISSTLSPLLSLAHYVSLENYNTAIRPALCALLPSILQYVLPSEIRAAAKTRTNHLGLSALDLDTAGDGRNRDDAIPGSEQIPRSLRTVRQSVSSIVRQPQHAAQFRLDALAEAALEPLSELLGNNCFFLTEERMTSLDCLAMGYLSLAFLPKMPQPWLADTMRKKYPNLCKFVNKGIGHCFQGPVTLDDARLPPDPEPVMQPDYESSKDLRLPWIPPPASNLLSTSQFVLDRTLSSLPFVFALRQDKVLLPSGNNDPPLAAPPFILPTLAGLGAAAAVAGSYLLYSSQNPSSVSENRKREDTGEVGKMLAGLDFGSAAAFEGEVKREPLF